jgi:phage shock protein A
MSTTTLIVNGASFQVSKRRLMMSCDLFERQTSLLDSPYAVRSSVSTPSFETFVSAIEGKPVTITPENYGDLVSLCSEFIFDGLTSSLSSFQSSQNPTDAERSSLLTRIAELEEECVNHAKGNAGLRSRIRELEAEVSVLKSTVCDLDQTTETFTDHYSELLSRCAELEQAHATEAARAASLERKCRELERDREALLAQCASLALRCTELDRTQMALRENQARLISRCQALEGQSAPSRRELIGFMSAYRKAAKHYERVRYLRGSWSLMRDRGSGKKVAAGYPMDDDSYLRRFFVRRVTLPLILNLPGIMQTVGFWVDSGKMWLATEYFPNGTLQAMLARMGKREPTPGFGPTQLTKCVFGVAVTMSRFHARRGIHRALVPGAVFLDSAFEPVIGRFSFAKIITDPLRMSLGMGVPMAMAPELSPDEEGQYDNSVDVYAYAMLLYCLFELGRPQVFDNRRPIRNSHPLLMGVRAGYRFPRPKAMPDEFWRLVTDCWQKEPARRPTFVEIVDRLKSSPGLVFPGTDIAAYREYQERLERQVLEAPRSVELVDAMHDLLGWDSSEGLADGHG